MSSTDSGTLVSTRFPLQLHITQPSHLQAAQKKQRLTGKLNHYIKLELLIGFKRVVFDEKIGAT
jgi:hypothetical protein